MPEIDRRAMLRFLLGGGAAVAGAALPLGRADSAPLVVNQALRTTENLHTDGLVEKAVAVVHTRPVRRRRRVCWWHRGRRVCRWR
jgi:hypothetical protein